MAAKAAGVVGLGVAGYFAYTMATGSRYLISLLPMPLAVLEP